MKLHMTEPNPAVDILIDLELKMRTQFALGNIEAATKLHAERMLRQFISNWWHRDNMEASNAHSN